MKYTTTFIFILQFFVGIQPAFSADDYLQALEAEADELGSEQSTVVHAKDVLQIINPSQTSITETELITAQLQAAFEEKLRQKSSVSFKTYSKLNAKHKKIVILYFLEHGASMENITMKLFEQYSLQIKNEE